VISTRKKEDYDYDGQKNHHCAKDR